MSLQSNFTNLVTTGKIEDILAKDSLVCFSFISENDKWQTLAEYGEWRLQINTKSGICRVIDSHIIRKVSSSLEKIEELINGYNLN